MKFRPHRYRTEFPVALATPAGNVKAVVNDVNETGVLMTIGDALQRGDPVRMRFLNSHADGIVQWAMRGRCGITFRPHLTMAQVDMLRQRAGSHGASVRHNSSGYSEMR